MRYPTNLLARLALLAFAAGSSAASAGVVNVTVDDTSPWIGYFNWYKLPTDPGTDRGAYIYGQLETNIAALPASVSGNVATMGPNSTLSVGQGDVSNPYWGDWWADSNGVVTPNAVIESNLYIDSLYSGLGLDGQDLVFTGITSASTLAAPYLAYAFIREFTASYNLVDEVLVKLVAGQSFELKAGSTAGNAVQYGFALVGPNAVPDTVGGLGSVSISAVPEPSTLALVMLGVAAAAARSRRRNWLVPAVCSILSTRAPEAMQRPAALEPMRRG